MTTLRTIRDVSSSCAYLFIVHTWIWHEWKTNFNHDCMPIHCIHAISNLAAYVCTISLDCIPNLLHFSFKWVMSEQKKLNVFISWNSHKCIPNRHRSGITFVLNSIDWVSMIYMCTSVYWNAWYIVLMEQRKILAWYTVSHVMNRSFVCYVIFVRCTTFSIFIWPSSWHRMSYDDLLLNGEIRMKIFFIWNIKFFFDLWLNWMY